MAEVRYTAFSGFDDDEGFIEESGDFIPSEENESYHYDPVITTPAYHIGQGEKAMEKLKMIVSEGGWKKALTVKNTTVYTKNGFGDNEKMPIYMCQHIIEKFSPQSIFAVIGMRKLWDPWYEEGNLIENLNDSTSLTYMVMQGIAGTRIRDLSLVEKIQCTQDGTIYFAATSVEKVPQVVDRIRASLHLNGWIIKPISYNPVRTRVTYVLQAKVNGWIPSVVAKKYLIRRPLVVHIIDQYLQKNGPPPMVISNSTSPPSSGRHSRSESNASLHAPRNITFKDKSLSDSPTQNNRITFNLGSDSNRSIKKEIRRKTSFDPQVLQINKSQSKKEIHRKTSLDSREMQNNRKEISFYLNKNNNLSAHSAHKEIQFNTSLNFPIMQNNRKEFLPFPDNENDLSSQSSQVTLEAHEQRLLLKPPSSPKQDQFPSSLDQETLTEAQPTSPIRSKPPIIPSLPSPPLSLPPPSSPQSYSPPPSPTRHQHSDAVNAAVKSFKDNIKTFEGWNFYSENKGVKIYTKDITGRSTPMFRGDYTLIGSFTTEDFLSVIKNLDLRKFWDDRYEDGENIKLFDNDNILSKVSLKGTFPISGRDFALCGTVERDPETSRTYFVTTSVIDPAIPEFKKYVRAHIYFTGWQITPEFDVDGNPIALDIVYVVDTDIKLESVPQPILKSISSGTPMVIQKIDEMMHKIGFPPYMMNPSSLIISESLNPKSFQYNLSFVGKSDSFTDIRFSRLMYPNGFDIIVVPKNTKVELLPGKREIVRITLPSEATTNKVLIKITKYTSGFKMTLNEKHRIPLAHKKIDQRPKTTIENISDSLRIAQSSLQSEAARLYKNHRHSRHSRNFSQPVNSLTNETVDTKQDSFSSPRQERHSRHSRNFSQPVNSLADETVDVKQDSFSSPRQNLSQPELDENRQNLSQPELDENIQNLSQPELDENIQNLSQPDLDEKIDADILVNKDDKSNEQKDQELSEKLPQLIDPNATLVASEIEVVNKNNEQDPIPKRKSKRISFADSPPSIINPQALYELKQAKNEYNESDEYEDDEFNEYVEIIRTFNEEPIDRHQMVDFSQDMIVITDTVKFNVYQIAIMFVGMILSYYSGRMSCPHI